MVSGGPRVLGVSFLLLAVSVGCTQPVTEQRIAERADVAVPSYDAGPDAPDYCAALAGSTAVLGIPEAVGTLAGDPGNVGAEVDLTAAIDELRTVLDDVRTDGRPGLDDAVEELVAALTAARDKGLTDTVRTDISSGLDEVGSLVQPTCRFPT